MLSLKHRTLAGLRLDHAALLRSWTCPDVSIASLWSALICSSTRRISCMRRSLLLQAGQGVSGWVVYLFVRSSKLDRRGDWRWLFMWWWRAICRHFGRWRTTKEREHRCWSFLALKWRSPRRIHRNRSDARRLHRCTVSSGREEESWFTWSGIVAYLGGGDWRRWAFLCLGGDAAGEEAELATLSRVQGGRLVSTWMEGTGVLHRLLRSQRRRKTFSSGRARSRSSLGSHATPEVTTRSRCTAYHRMRCSARGGHVNQLEAMLACPPHLVRIDNSAPLGT